MFGGIKIEKQDISISSRLDGKLKSVFPVRRNKNASTYSCVRQRRYYFKTYFKYILSNTWTKYWTSNTNILNLSNLRKSIQNT